MTLYQTIRELQRIALKQPNIRTVGDGDIYDTMSSPELRYGVFFITQNTHRRDGDFDYYTINMFVIDRLTSDKSNELQIESNAKDIIDNVIKTFCIEDDSEVNGTISYQPFTQQFNDLTAGMYATVTLMVDSNFVCPEVY